MDSFTPHKNNDFSFVKQEARIAIYDDVQSLPRVVEIRPNNTAEFIQNLSEEVYRESKNLGGEISYTVINQVVQNFIHASFNEIVVSVLDGGNTIKFTDQGPGIENKEKAVEPGFSSATSEMKNFIDGVGFGLCYVKEYADLKNGSIKIEDNLAKGSVVTISLKQDGKLNIKEENKPIILKRNEKTIIKSFKAGEQLRIIDIEHSTRIPSSSIYSALSNLEKYGFIEKLPNKRRTLTEKGFKYCQNL